MMSFFFAGLKILLIIPIASCPLSLIMPIPELLAAVEIAAMVSF